MVGDASLLLYIEYATGLVGAGTALAAYVVKARGTWWRNPVGQLLVTLGAVAIAWYAKGLFLSRSPNLSTWNLVSYAVFALLFVYMGVVMVVVLARKRPPPPGPAELARLAYEGYAARTGGLTFDGRPMPAWADLPERTVQAWIAAALAVADEAS